MSAADHPKHALLDDLESIRALLDEDEDLQALPAQDDAEDPVPLLDDVVAGGISLEETPPEHIADAGDDAAERRNAAADNDEGIDEALFAALLGDSWKQSAADMLEETRAEIERHRSRWSPEDTETLNEALQVRIDETLTRWLREVVRHNIDALRAELLAATRETLEAALRDILAAQPAPANQNDNSKDGPDGQ